MHARPVEPGKTYLLSRRTAGRMFLFRPDEDGTMQNIFKFCLITTALVFGIRIHAFVLMSTHFHIVLTDTRGIYPKFLNACHTLLARATQCHRGWGEAVLNKAQTSMVELPSVATMIDKIAYVIANPVAAGAVYCSIDWPGACTRVGDIGRSVIRATLPGLYFLPKKWAPEVSMPTTWPDAFLEEMSAEEARARVREAVERHEREARAEMRRRGRTFLGERRATRVDFTRRAVAYEVWGARNPTFAAGADRALFFEMAQRRRAFRAAYAAALTRWRAEERDVEFPPGTWWMRIFHGAHLQPDTT